MIELWEAAFLGALEAEHPTKQVKALVKAGALDDWLKDPERPETLHVFAVGKAAASMAWGLAECNVPMMGRGVLPDGVQAPKIPGMQWVHTAHPVPDERSFAEGQQWLERAAKIPRDAPVLLLLSGGASSLLEWPKQSFPPDGDIETLNAKRMAASELKGGKWVQQLKQRTNNVRAWILPDVPPGKEETLVGSGLAQGADCTILRSNQEFVQTMAGFLESFGVRTEVYPHRLQGPVEEQIAMFCHDAQKDVVRIGGGECFVPGAPNRVGGRNHHAALAAAISCNGTFLALGTDGQDGSTGAAGAHSKPDDSAEAKAAFAAFDAHAYLSTSFVTGHVGTNVNDVWLYLAK